MVVVIPYCLTRRALELLEDLGILLLHSGEALCPILGYHVRVTSEGLARTVLIPLATLASICIMSVLWIR